MSKITNTSKLGPHIHLRDAMLVGSSEAIVASERHGAAEMAAQTTQLPTRGSNDYFVRPGVNEPITIWEKMGVIFGDPIPDDPIFRSVTLPAGWKIERTDHNMWTKLVDEKGRERASIFYKAAFYDRSAHIKAECRYKVNSEYLSDESLKSRVVIKDCSTVLQAWPYRENYAETGQDLQEAREVLSTKFLNHTDPTAYWD